MDASGVAEYCTPTIPFVKVVTFAVVTIALAMVKVTGFVVPAAVVTLRLTVPDAVAEMIKVAVSSVPLATLTLLIETAGLLAFTIAPELKFVPLKVMFILVPGAPEFGMTDVMVGAVEAAELMVKVTEPVSEPLAEATATLAEPVALAEIAKVAEI